jgi:phage-related protein
MTSVGNSVYEIRVQDQSGAFRVIYIAKFAQCVYVLHCFQKKTQKTAQKDLNLAKHCLTELRKELHDEEE